MMDSETGRTQASLLLHDYGCCPRCVMRMLHGATCKSEDFLSLDSATYESPVCPICCGLLHHPRLCSLPTDYNLRTYETPNNPQDRNLLAETLYKMDKSDFEYLACQFKITEPMNHLVREHVIWSRLYDLVTGCNKSTLFDRNWRIKHPAGQIRCLFTMKDLENWHSTFIPITRVWHWIVQPVLFNSLQVPIVISPNDVNNAEFLRTNNIDSSMFDPETVVLSVSVEIYDKYDQEECQEFLEETARTAVPEVRVPLLNMVPGGKKMVQQWLAHSAFRGGKAKRPTIRFQVSRQRLINVLNAMWQNATSPFLSLPEDAFVPIVKNVNLTRPVSVVLGGRYVKFHRRLPQTPWVIDEKRKLPSSVEELILDPIREKFGSGSNLTFTSSGREDVDARCLGLGRPFMVRVGNFEAFLPDVVRSCSVALSESRDSNAPDSKTPMPVDLLRLASTINAQAGGRIMVRDLQLVASENACKAIKSGELSKSKHYRAVCWCPEGGLTTEMIRRFSIEYMALPGKRRSTPPIESQVWPPHSPADQSVSSDEPPYPVLQFGGLFIRQLTPIRVLHRRAPLSRSRYIHSFQLADYEAAMAHPDAELADYASWSKIYRPEELFILSLHCDAGTYVKEFVHGDLGRTVPSLSSLFGRHMDLLALDVTAVDLDWPPCLADP